MRVLIITIKSRIFHLVKFAEELKKLQIDCDIIDDNEFLDKSYNFVSKYKKNRKFKKKLDALKPDVVLLDRQTELGLLVIEKKIPLFVTVRGHIWKEREWAEETLYKSSSGKFSLRRRNEIVTKCLNGADIILPLSDYLTEIVQDYFPQKKVLQLSISSRDSKDWNSKSKMDLRHPCVGFLQGANIWGKTKGLIDFGKVIESLPEIMFYWAGDGVYTEKVLKSLEKYENFKWLGNLGYPEVVKEFLSSIDVYALPTGMDTLGQSIIEASLMKKPVVATDVGGIPEVIDEGVTGYLIKNDNDWTEKIKLLCNDENKREELGENGRMKMIEKFNWEKTAKSFKNILNQSY